METQRQEILNEVYRVICERRKAPADESYVASLFDRGLDKILGKIGEEAVETAVAAKGGDPRQLVHEMADLWFHCLVLLGYCELTPEQVFSELQRRFGMSGHVEKAARETQGKGE